MKNEHFVKYMDLATTEKTSENNESTDNAQTVTDESNNKDDSVSGN